MSEIKQIDMTDDKWIDKFKPIPRDGIKEGLISGYDCGDGPCLWETYGKDIDEVLRRMDQPEWEGRLWTVHDDTAISDGFHIVNRLGYIFTEKPADPNAHYYIFDDMEDEEDE